MSIVVVAIAARIQPGAPLAPSVLVRSTEVARPAVVSTGPCGEAERSLERALPRTARAEVIQRAIWRAAIRTKVDPLLAINLAHVESRLDASEVSRAGARGVMQLMPATAAGLGVDPRNLKQNIRGGVTYLRQLLDRFEGDEVLAIAAYNAGPTRVMRTGAVPNIAETRAHVAKLRARMLLVPLTLPLPPARS